MATLTIKQKAKISVLMARAELAITHLNEGNYEKYLAMQKLIKNTLADLGTSQQDLAVSFQKHYYTKG